MHLFSRAKKESYFASAYLGEWQIFENFVITYLCEWQVFENFEFISFSPKEKRITKKTVESRDIRLMFLSRSTERQAGHDGKTVVIDWFLKKSWYSQKILRIFFLFFFVNLFLTNVNFLHIWRVFIFSNAF